MPYQLFLDDERDPPTQGSWVVVRSVAQAVRHILAHGAPNYVSFDNDLGRRLEGRHLARWLVRRDVQAQGQFLPETFDFYVHSQNSVNGIEGVLREYLNQRPHILTRLAAGRSATP